jgi:hypothetical protein
MKGEVIEWHVVITALPAVNTAELSWCTIAAPWKRQDLADSMLSESAEPHPYRLGAVGAFDSYHRFPGPLVRL